MELGMHFISNAQTLRSDTVQDLKVLNSQSLTTQAKESEQLVPMMPAIRKAFDLMGDDTVDFSTETESLKNQTGGYDEKWLEESKIKLLKQINDEKRATSIKSRITKQMENF